MRNLSNKGQQHHGSEDSMLYRYHALHTIAGCLPDPDVQRPKLVTFIGNREKSIAIRKALGVCPKRKKRNDYHFYLAPFSREDTQPLILADWDMSMKNERTASTASFCSNL
jgi:hypothetical protein